MKYNLFYYLFIILCCVIPPSLIHASETTVNEQPAAPFSLAISAKSGLLLTGAALIGYAAHTYYQSAIAPTQEVVDESLQFIDKLIANPYEPINSYLKDNVEMQIFFDMLALKKKTMVRSLNRFGTYYNPYNFFYAQQTNEHKLVDELFKELEAHYRHMEDNTIQRDNEAFIASIKKRAKDIYPLLVQAKNSIHPGYINTFLDAIVKTASYTIPNELLSADYASLYTELKQTIENPKRFIALEKTTVGAIEKTQKALRDSEKKALKTVGLNHRFMHYIPGWGLSEKNKEDKKAFETLYTHLIASAGPALRRNELFPSDESFNEKITQAAQRCCTLLLHRLDDAQKWKIINDFIARR